MSCYLLPWLLSKVKHSKHFLPSLGLVVSGITDQLVRLAMTSTSNSEWTHFCGLWLPGGAFIAPPDDITTSGRHKINRKSAQQKKIGRTQRSTSRRNVHLIDVQSAIHPTAGSVHEPETRGAQRRIRSHPAALQQVAN